MSAETKKTINAPKALSALSVGGVSYPAVMRTIESVADNNGWEWLTNSAAHHWLGVIVAGVLAAVAAWRTQAGPGKIAEVRQAKLEQKVADVVARQNGHADQTLTAEEQAEA